MMPSQTSINLEILPDARGQRVVWVPNNEGEPWIGRMVGMLAFVYVAGQIKDLFRLQYIRGRVHGTRSYEFLE